MWNRGAVKLLQLLAGGGSDEGLSVRYHKGR